MCCTSRGWSCSDKNLKQMLAEDKSQKKKSLFLTGPVRNQVSLMFRSSQCARSSFCCSFLRRGHCSLNALTSEFLCLLVHECWSYKSEIHLIKWKVAFCPEIWLSTVGLSPFLGILFSLPSSLVTHLAPLFLMLLRTWGKPCLHHPNTGCYFTQERGTTLLFLLP